MFYLVANRIKLYTLKRTPLLILHGDINRTSPLQIKMPDNLSCLLQGQHRQFIPTSQP